MTNRTSAGAVADIGVATDVLVEVGDVDVDVDVDETNEFIGGIQTYGATHAVHGRNQVKVN